MAQRHPTLRYLVRRLGFTAKDDLWYNRDDLIHNAAELVNEYDREQPIDWQHEMEIRRTKQKRPQTAYA
ncbi:hypothetical protein NKR19_g5169 [Coniochaeta hoffmannii]|uniref:Uncharacterized protein n=1 Tax=Coniochaeta hoffmannii TaxID=91930 RepID=A0AA38VLQ5_9PEZI|nr:hypothetical protein NKR19_g5169 [Coniochaeta hoffmannii]